MTVLVLDVDGVVVLGHRDGGRWDKDVKRDFGLKPEYLQTRWFQPHWPKIEIGEADLYETLERVWPELECRGTPSEFIDYWFGNHSQLDKAVLAEADAWRASGRKAYLATVQEHHRAKYLWDVLKLRDHFDGMLYSAALGAKKPDRAFFERALPKLPVSAPDEILFLDDRQENVDAANACGWQAYLHRDVEDMRRAIAGV